MQTYTLKPNASLESHRSIELRHSLYVKHSTEEWCICFPYPASALQERVSEIEERCSEKLREMEAQVSTVRKEHTKAGSKINCMLPPYTAGLHMAMKSYP